jgi:hypothetical protein
LSKRLDVRGAKRSVTRGRQLSSWERGRLARHQLINPKYSTIPAGETPALPGQPGFRVFRAYHHFEKHTHTFNCTRMFETRTDWPM